MTTAKQSYSPVIILALLFSMLLHFFLVYSWLQTPTRDSSAMSSGSVSVRIQPPTESISELVDTSVPALNSARMSEEAVKPKADALVVTALNSRHAIAAIIEKSSSSTEAKSDKKSKALIVEVETVEGDPNQAEQNEIEVVDFEPQESTADNVAISLLDKHEGTSTDDLDKNNRLLKEQENNRQLLTQWYQEQISKQFNYPGQAIRRDWQGTVLLQFNIQYQAGISNVKVLKSSGFSLLDNNAKDTLVSIASELRYSKMDEHLIPFTNRSMELTLPITYRLQ